MELKGEVRIAAEQDAVWAALNDPDLLKECIPGCQSMERTSPATFTATIRVRFALISVTLTGIISLSNIRAPESYTIQAEGKGGVAGFAKGSADVVLQPDGDETILIYDAGGETGGKLAQLGSRLVGSTTEKLARKFFADFTAAANRKAAE